MGERAPQALAEADPAAGRLVSPLVSFTAPPPVAAMPPAPADNGAAAALGLYARLLAASTLEAGAHALVAALASEPSIRRASIALHENGRTRLLASSNLDLGNPQAELPQRLLGAMNEALDQRCSVALPPVVGADGRIADHIRIEHQALQRLVGGAVLCLPLGIDGQVLAVVCLERDGDAGFDAAEFARLERTLMLTAPAMRWMQQGTQRWFRRAWRELLAGCQALRQPGKRTTRRLLGAGAVLLAFLALAPLQFEVGGRARIEGAEQRLLSAPTDGFVKTAHVRPGDRVKAGAPLIDLLEQDLRLEQERWSSQLAQHENAYASSMARSDRVGAATSMARIAEAQAQLALIGEQLTRGRITAPFDAMVIDGDLSQSIGAPVRQGDKMMTLATTDSFRVIADIDEIDIGRVAVGQGGSLALSSLPWDQHAIEVTRVAPLAKAVDGRNIFEVEARLLEPPAELRPGLLGRAEVVVGRRPPLWAWLGHAADRMRLAWWNFFG
ncbi:efflux RND transporter periplasmic adaptor subunit [Piscinibacter sakaiensis]|uniref:efflux RND transporter periplasmic adaptor subunit n=1 Tax=Piscinibacter sakaiensis TaxID=1547922 RepID=UPI003AAFA5A7